MLTKIRDLSLREVAREFAIGVMYGFGFAGLLGLIILGSVFVYSILKGN